MKPLYAWTLFGCYLLAIWLYQVSQQEVFSCEAFTNTIFSNQQIHVHSFFNDAVNEQSNDIDQKLICALKNATSTIDAHFYQANNKDIAEAFVDAHQRGVKVRFITDDHYYDDARYYRAFYKNLVENGIPLIHDQIRPHTNGQSHNKFAIIDKTYVWTGSYNITDNGTSKNANNALLIHSPSVAKDFELEFNEMWGGKDAVIEPQLASFGNYKERNTTNFHSIYQHNDIQLCFDPSDNCLEAMYETIRKAQKSISFAVFSFTDDTLGQLLVQKAQEGVKVQGIFHNPDCRYGEYANLKKVSPDSIFLRTQIQPTPRLIHHKYMIIDPDSEDTATVITGSKNWSSSSEKYNDENTIIIHDQKIVQEFNQNFGSIMDKITDLKIENECE